LANQAGNEAVISLLFVLLGIAGILHQRFILNAGWFDWAQFLHHEALIAMCFTFASGLFIGGKLNGRKRCKRV
jgi:hypothetical protein